MNVWQKLYVNELRPVDQLFSRHNFHPLKIIVRHGGDPIVAALNLSNKPGGLEFGESSRELMIRGATFIIISLIFFVIICHKMHSIGVCDWSNGETEQEK